MKGSRGEHSREARGNAGRKQKWRWLRTRSKDNVETMEVMSRDQLGCSALEQRGG
jgi:hypothetical protein